MPAMVFAMQPKRNFGDRPDPASATAPAFAEVFRPAPFSVGLACSRPAWSLAIGDVRAGSTKRIAAAVGEGAAVVAQVYAGARHATFLTHKDPLNEDFLAFIRG
jgi:hypothetical protein